MGNEFITCAGVWLFRCHGDAGVPGERPAAISAVLDGMAQHLADVPPYSSAREPSSPSA